MPKPETLQLLQKAKEDEDTIDAVLPRKLWNIDSYHAQQAAEKFIKAAIVESNGIPLRSHDLVDLIKVHPKYIANQKIVDAADRLTPMASDSRYPGFSNFTQSEAEQAVVDLNLRKAWALSQIL